MKKLIAILMVVFTMLLATACNVNFGSSSFNAGNGGNQEMEDPNETENNVVSPITGGGDFNAENNYNK